MALTALDVFNNYSNDKKGFIAAMKNDPNAGALWDNFKKISTKGSGDDGSFSKSSATMGQMAKTLTGVQDITAGTTLSQTELFNPVSDVSNYLTGILDAVKQGGSFLQKVDSVLNAAVLNPMLGAVKQVTFFTEKELQLRNQIVSQLSIAGDLMLDYRKNVEDAAVSMVDVGYGFDDVSRTMIDLTKQTGTMSQISSGVFEENRFVIRAAIGDLQNLPGFIKNFSDIGVGAQSAFKQIEKSFKGSLELGLLGRETVAKIGENLSKINSFGFKNGVDGLTKMTQKSVEFKANMETTFNLAEKLFDPDKALELTANLQAVGGAIGDFNDPIKLMYMAVNDVGGLQDAYIGVTKSLATYNQEQQRFEVSGVNLRRARALAEQFGTTVDEIGKTAVKTAERYEASTQLMSRGLSLDDKQMEFISNLTRMEGGRMVIDVSSISDAFKGSQTLFLDELTDEQSKTLLQYQKQLTEMDTKDIAREQFSVTQNIALNVSALVALGRLSAGRLTGELGKTLDDMFGKNLNESIIRLNEKLGPTLGVKPERPKYSENLNMKSENKVEPKTSLDKNKMMGSTNESTTMAEPKTVTTKQEIAITMNVPTVLDPVARGLMNKPEFVDDIKNGIFDNRAYI